ncbi:hypothetical protein DFJ74DRAFT_706600 [Hyaloraphidium curvatum]|nr:hypothetical protein DFJ74DRAFT_706600 [Hyaloraphidium curvatum]
MEGVVDAFVHCIEDETTGAKASAVSGAVALLVLVPASRASHSGLNQQEWLDPATGLINCVYGRWSDSGYGGSRVRCVGACEGGDRVVGVGRRVRGRDFAPGPAECERRGSCVRIPSLGCAFVAVEDARAAGWYGSASVACRGNGTCTLFSDPWCLDAIGPAPQSAGPTECIGPDGEKNITNITSFVPWCVEAHSSLFGTPVPESASCSDLSHLVANNTPWTGDWTCMRTCDGPLPGLYISVRRIGFGNQTDGQCATGFPSNPNGLPLRTELSCAYFCDQGCTHLFPGPDYSLAVKGFPNNVACNGMASTFPWCPAALALALNDTLPPEPLCEQPGCPPEAGTTRCLRSYHPDDQGHYFLAAELTPADGGRGPRVACAGPRNGTFVPDLAFFSGPACSWFVDGECTELAPSEPAPAALVNNRVVAGFLCPERTNGTQRAAWCDRAELVFATGRVESCPGEPPPPTDARPESGAVRVGASGASGWMGTLVAMAALAVAA